MVNDDIIYIGVSTDIHSRITRHCKTIPNITKIYIILFDDIGSALKKEALLIRHFKPLLNRAGKCGKVSEPKKPKRDKISRLLTESTTLSINKVLSTLDEREEMVIRHRHGVGDSKFMKSKELGFLYGVTRQRIHQIQKKAERKLLHPTRAKRFIKK